MNYLSTDVLIVGSGGAGLRAAIEARRHRVKALVISKTQMDLASCTASAMGAFKVSREKKAVEKHFQETLEAGRVLNDPSLVKILVTEAWPAVKELEKIGVKLLVEKNKASIIADKPQAGIALSKALSKYALSLGVNVLERTIASDLLVDESKCFGALALKIDTKEIIAISAKAVVLATGGYSRLYIRNDNPPTITGDGLVLAFQAGAELQDLEFIQFQPMFIDIGVPRMPILDWLIEATKNLVPDGPLLNKRGERFLDRYGLLKQKILRDNLVLAIEREILEEDDYVVFDLTQLNLKEIEKAIDSEFYRRTIHPFKQILSTRKLRIASSAHYTMGGIRINRNCETKVEGLYAVGEVTSGIHGANRLGGNALTEVIVFGKIAGSQAAEYTKHAKFVQISQRHIEESKKLIQEFGSRSRSKRIDSSPVKRNVKFILSKFCKPIRSRKSLTYALDELKRMEKEEASFMFEENPAQLKEAIEAKSMLTLAKLVVNSALAREESRGVHFRIDYPKSNDEKWLKNILLTKERNKTRIAYLPIKS